MLIKQSLYPHHEQHSLDQFHFQATQSYELYVEKMLYRHTNLNSFDARKISKTCLFNKVVSSHCQCCAANGELYLSLRFDRLGIDSSCLFLASSTLQINFVRTFLSLFMELSHALQHSLDLPGQHRLESIVRPTSQHLMDFKRVIWVTNCRDILCK